MLYKANILNCIATNNKFFNNKKKVLFSTIAKDRKLIENLLFGKK